MVRSKRLRQYDVETAAEDQIGSPLAESRFGSSRTQPVPPAESSQNQASLQDPVDVEYTDPLEIIDDQGRVRRKRGRTCAKDVWDMPAKEKIIIKCNPLGQPVKRGGGILGGWLGMLARKPKMCPLNFTSWHRMPLAFKMEMIKVTRKYFELPSDTRIDQWVLKSIDHKWKDFKYELKAKYMVEGHTEQQIASNGPPDIPHQQWIELVHYWFSEKSENYSRIGREARAQQKNPHTSGSMSNARKRDEFEVEHGREPGPIEFFSLTHKRRDGSYVNRSSQQFVESATALMVERASTSESSDATSLERRIYHELMGEERYGRVRGYGLGVTPTQIFGVESQIRHIVEPNPDVQRLEAKIQAMQSSYEAKLSAVQAQLEQVTSILQRFAEGRESSRAVADQANNNVNIQVPDALTRLGDDDEALNHLETRTRRTT